MAFVQHAGGLAGYRTHLVAYPSERLAIVFLSNDAAAIPSLAAFHVAESCLGERMTPAPAGIDLPIESVRACAGLYRGTNNDNVLPLVEQDGRLALQGMPLRALGPGRFAFERSIAGSTLTFDDDSAASSSTTPAARSTASPAVTRRPRSTRPRSPACSPAPSSPHPGA